MRKKNSKYQLPDFADSIFEPDDLMTIYFVRNGCGYRWGIPYKTYKSDKFQYLEEPYEDEVLISLGAKLLDILILNTQTINFKDAKTGVLKLEVSIRSSESDDRQLLHKLTSEIRLKDNHLNRDNIPGTSKENE